MQVELDALAPDSLRALFAAALPRYWDPAAYQAAVERDWEDSEELKASGRVLGPKRAVFHN